MENSVKGILAISSFLCRLPILYDKYFKEWRERRFTVPEEVSKATEEYREEMDPLSWSRKPPEPQPHPGLPSLIDRSDPAHNIFEAFLLRSLDILPASF